uniref:Uncharacterized protein n=1 Tax=Sphaerodactylus townsendi TaxID=933632 RepID=A0ACB8EMG1_9SAUR
MSSIAGIQHQKVGGKEINPQEQELSDDSMKSGRMNISSFEAGVRLIDVVELHKCFKGIGYTPEQQAPGGQKCWLEGKGMGSAASQVTLTRFHITLIWATIEVMSYTMMLHHAVTRKRNSKERYYKVFFLQRYQTMKLKVEHEVLLFNTLEYCIAY